MRNEVFGSLQEAVKKLGERGKEFPRASISEEAVSKRLAALLADQGYQVRSRVNLWNLVEGVPYQRKGLSILKSFRHPLQPDIDLLVEDKGANRKLWGFEFKLIRWSGTLFSVVPRGRFYSGLDQVLSIATWGVDYACLFHIFVPPMLAYRKLERRSPKVAEQFDDDRAEFTAAYGGIVQGILDRFSLPIGYGAIGLFSDQVSRKVHVVPITALWRAPERLERTATGDRIRPLLLKALR